ncbi:MAG: hypothetical protein OXH27_02450 [Gammaproteobacteria bacterium]|nr:hypothetical protein [Gammaproteobacteria bacterium]
MVPAVAHGPTVTLPEATRFTPSTEQYRAFSPLQVRVAVPEVMGTRSGETETVSTTGSESSGLFWPKAARGVRNNNGNAMKKRRMAIGGKRGAGAH